MDSTEGSPQSHHSFAIVFGVTIAALSSISIITFLYYICTRKPLPPADSDWHGSSISSDNQDSVAIKIGLDEATLKNFPQILSSEVKLVDKGESVRTCCSICLSDYKDSDLLRLLPDCDHLFHSQCVDPWIKMHNTCPICRNSPDKTACNFPAEMAPRTPRRPFSDPWFVQMMR